MADRRERLRSIPHMRASEVTVVDVPPQNGLIGYKEFLVTTACGEELPTTLTTRRADRVRCEKCKAAKAALGAGTSCPECGGTGEIEVGHHTCGTGPDGYYGHHEPGCGTEPCPAGCEYVPPGQRGGLTR